MKAKEDVAPAKDRNIYQRLLAVSQGCGYIRKGGKNKDQGWSFATFQDVYDKVMELCADNGVWPELTILREHTSRSTYATKSGAMGHRVETIWEVVFVNTDNPEDRTAAVYYPGEGMDTGDKGSGKCISLGQKYALLGALKIPTGEDPDSSTPEESHPAKVAAPAKLKSVSTITITPEEKMKGLVEAIVSGEAGDSTTEKSSSALRKIGSFFQKETVPKRWGEFSIDQLENFYKEQYG